MKKLISLELLKTSLEAIMDKLKLKADKAYVEESIDNLSVELNSTLNNKTNNSDFENHINNTEKHTSLEEKTSWNNKSGEKVAGKSFTLDSNNKTVIAGTGAERFNNYSKNIATGTYSHAEGSYTEASGNYSHAEGSSAKATGTYSHAEGTSTYAVGQGSHAEGSASWARGNYSHSEGYSTEANGESSHAEGNDTMASANYSHAEGIKTKATGQASHAEGSNTTASKVGAHAEGYYSTASGDYSHSEGYYTIASKSYQHAQGKYNVEDTGNKYAHIIGNGSASNKRSNAHTVDWSGNAWFAGDVYIGGTSQDDAVKLENITIDETLSDTSTNPVQNKVIKAALDTLSSSGVVVDSTLSTESTNPVQNKVITSKVNEITESLETIKNKPAVQPDWNQNDESAADYIKNRTHYVIDSGFEITWDGDMTGRDTIDVSLIGFSGTLVKVSDLILSSEQFIGASMKKSDGTEQVLEQSNLSILPNAAVCELTAAIVSIESVANTSAAFGGLPIPSTGTYFNTNSGVYVNYFKSEPKLQKIDRKFLPDSLPGIIVAGKEFTINGETVIAGPGAEIFNDGTNIATGDCSHAEGWNTTASGYRSHAEGWSAIASGDNSHAEGAYTIASGDYSHAEGWSAIASGNYSHAEGTSTTASGNYSHAEGYNTTASGDYSHAEGWSAIASGYRSHAEGYNTTASGYDSHAEGWNTTASGDNSHAEGQYTTASGDCQHVQGKYNIEDTDNKYAHIVGNGIYTGSEPTYSNAHTLDWSGNAWYAGKVYVGGTSQDDPNAVELKNIIVDDILSDDSTNPVQNKVIKAALDTLSSAGVVVDDILSTESTNPVQNKVITTSLNAHINDFNIHVTNEEKEAWNNKSEFSGSYNDLTNKPTDLASTSYVDNKVAELVNSAPEALNTLDELAEALGNDENFATTVTNALAGKASQNDLYTHINNTDVHITAEEKALIANIDNLATKEYVDKDSVIFNLNKLIEDKEWGTKDSALGNTIIPFINYLNTNQINLENGISVLFKTSEQVSTEEGSRNVWQRWMLCDKDNYSKKIAWHLENADFEIPSTITEDIETLKNKTYSLEVDGYQSGTVNLELKDNNGTLTTIPFVEGYGIDLSSPAAGGTVNISANSAADYGTCSTAGYDSAKVVSCTGFTLKTGAKISVLFSNEHTGFYNSLTLNVNNTGAKSIYYKKGFNVPEGCIKAGSVLDFRYNGMQWVLEGFYDFANAESLSEVEGRVATAEGQITGLDGRITNAETQITKLVSKTHPYYGTCSTIGGTVKKIVSCDGFELSTNTIITVRFDSTNTAESATLNVNNTGAKKIRYKGSDVAPYIIKGAGVYTFIYTSSGVYDLIGESEFDYCFTTTDTSEGVQERATERLNGFTLYTGKVVNVKFAKTVTHASPKLNVSFTGAKSMKYKSNYVKPYSLQANKIYTFQYDGTDWILIGGFGFEDVGGTITSRTSGKNGVIELYKQSTSSSDPVVIDFTKNGTAWGSLGFSSAGVLERFTVSGESSFKIHDAKSIQAGSVSITPTAANANTSGSVTFPVAFSSKPKVFVCADSTAPSTTVKGVTAYNPTTTGVSIYLNRSNTTATTIYWLAIEY